MKLASIIIIVILLCGCSGITNETRLSNMKSPVVLVGKHHMVGCMPSVTLKDSVGVVINIAGGGIAYDLQCRVIGDTIK